MGHMHGSLNCPDCSRMGVRPRIETRKSGSAEPLSEGRLSTSGFEHVYSGGDKAESSRCDGVDALAVITVSEGNTGVAPLRALTRAVEEQAALLADHLPRLEAATYRIGYLEAMLSAREEQLKMLPDLRLTAARALSNERRADELQDTVAQLELELANLKGAWWYRFARWLLGH